MDIFSTNVLAKVVENLPTPSSFLLDTFFPNVQTSDKEEIFFDVTDSKPRITPFVNALFNKLSTLTGVSVKRNETLPQKIPDTGIVLLRDGNMGKPTILLSPLHYRTYAYDVTAGRYEIRATRLDGKDTSSRAGHEIRLVSVKGYIIRSTEREPNAGVL